jgi:hypothetical protein
MAEQTPRTATGPALMEKLLEVEQLLREVSTEARKHWEQDRRRMDLIDRFVDPNLEIESLLKQLFAAIRRSDDAKRDLIREVQRLSGAVEVAISDPAREVNGTRQRGAD